MTIHDCQQELREVDLKVTPARLGILGALEHTNTPLDVQELISYLEEKDIKADKVTVFRIINSFTEKGIAVPIQFNEGKLRYEHVSRATHHHFICEMCGRVEDISDCNIDTLQSEIQRKKKLLVKRHSLEFFGLCTDCQK